MPGSGRKIAVRSRRTSGPWPISSQRKAFAGSYTGWPHGMTNWLRSLKTCPKNKMQDDLIASGGQHNYSHEINVLHWICAYIMLWILAYTVIPRYWPNVGSTVP